MTRAVLSAGLLAAAILPAAAQTAISTAGNVGSASLRGGYPAAGGAVALPALPSATATPTNAAGTPTAAVAATGGTTAANAAGGGFGGSRGGAGATTATRSSRGGGTNWVLCPPSGASGLAPLFTGTDLSCAPD